MRSSQSLLSFSKIEDTDFTSFLQQVGYIHKESSGVFHLSTLGILALQKLEKIIRHSFNHHDCTEWQLSLLQSQEHWDITQRDKAYGEELMAVKLRNKKIMRLAATAEEQITAAVSQQLSGRSLQYWFYQINTKWRDEIRVRAGLIRSKEFKMLDAYSFDNNEEAMLIRYNKGKKAIIEILEQLGCTYRIVSSDCGEIGGTMSEEIQVKTSLEESEWLEVAHCFTLGQTYSKAFNLKNNLGEHAWMTCHGLGVTRLLAVLLHERKNGLQILGDKHFHVIDHVIVAIGKNKTTAEKAERLYHILKATGDSVLWEDRFDRAGQALTASEMVGAQKRWIVSDRMDENEVSCLDYSKEQKEEQKVLINT